MEGGTTFHFVTDGIESALEQAKEAGGGKDVRLWGGADVARQYLAAGLLDELELHVVAVVLGDGARLFDNLGDAEVQLEQVRGVEAPGHPPQIPGGDMKRVAERPRIERREWRSDIARCDSVLAITAGW
jgi:dihydrofolate reductase